MTRTILTAAVLALSAASAFAATDNSITGKAMADHPGTHGGTTANPLAHNWSGSLSDAQMQQQLGGRKGFGRTNAPTAKDDDGSLSSKVMKDQLWR